MRRCLLIGLLLAAAPVYAHTLGETEHAGWSFEFWVWVPLALSAVAYLAALWRLHHYDIRRRVVGIAQCGFFALGMLSLVIALMSPLDALAEQLFSAHMTQHLMLMLVAPPLLILGRPGNVLLWTFSLRVRRGIGRIWRRAGLRVAWHVLSQPIPVWLMASAAMWFWHIPGPYTWAFIHPGIHVLEHMSFFLTSLAFWALVMQPFSRAKSGHGPALVLLATFALESSLLGALLAFAGHPLYAVHVGIAHHLPHWLPEITPLQDQQLAGLIMWIPASLVQLVAIGAVFADWMERAENPSKRPAGLRRDPRLAL
ncbi:MAG TPA: cytochrome c oxidase assembly protein [Methylophilaceae bacterium]|nr:cytochrome c oxidase assembly protein [Methylophilaceae bacterium]